MPDQPIADLLGGDGDHAPPPNPFAGGGQDAKTGTSHAATPNGEAANGNAGSTDADSFAPPPATTPAPSLDATHTSNGAPETPSEKLSRGFGRLGGALGGLGATVGRGIQTASTAATAAVAKTPERIDAVGQSGANGLDKHPMPNGGSNADGASGGNGEGGRRGPRMNRAMQRTLSGVAASSSASPKPSTSESNAAPNSGNSTTGGFSLGSSIAALGSATASLTTSLGDGLSSTTAALSQSLTVRPHTMPDRTVASQVLMYRQLLHTECKPGLRLSRAFQGTPAQRAVMHMPWWEQGVEKTQRMVISYDNLIVRLWLSGAIMPYVDGGYAHDVTAAPTPTAAAAAAGRPPAADDLPDPSSGPSSSGGQRHVDSLIDAQGLPPIPHPHWVHRLGFQQTDPVTDFRSGGVLSLAMLVHIVEACPHVHCRFLPHGPAHMLPLGITCINITDMLAKFLMFSKSVDRIDALLSQKPFWTLFGDPNALLVCQELAMDMLADVVVELVRERNMPRPGRGKNDLDGKRQNQGLHGETEGKVTVFDFAEILEITEKRVRDDLLGAGPKTVQELRAVHGRIKARYEKAIGRKERDAQRKYGKKKDGNAERENPIAAGAGALLGKIGREKKADDDAVPTKTVTAIEEVPFGDSHDETDAGNANSSGTADLLSGDNHAPIPASTVIEAPIAASEGVGPAASATPLSDATQAPVPESAPALAMVTDAPEPAPAPAPAPNDTTTAEAAAILAEPDLLSGANPTLSQEEADFLGALDDFDIGDEDLDDDNILDFLDNAATK